MKKSYSTIFKAAAVFAAFATIPAMGAPLSLVYVNSPTALACLTSGNIDVNQQCQGASKMVDGIALNKNGSIDVQPLGRSQVTFYGAANQSITITATADNSGAVSIISSSTTSSLQISADKQNWVTNTNNPIKLETPTLYIRSN
jgi:hypothetical protein